MVTLVAGGAEADPLADSGRDAAAEPGSTPVADQQPRASSFGQRVVEPRVAAELAVLAAMSSNLPAEPTIAVDATAYTSHEDLVDDVLAAVQLRARTAAAHRDLLARGDQLASVWPRQLALIERRIEERLAVTESSLPLQLVRDRLHLNRDEERILWTLIAHDIDPVAREWIRNVGTEDTADPTTDTLRRIVYGRTSSHSAWLDLCEDGGLRRLALMVRTGAAELPEHRQTWKASRRVLALAHGMLTLDSTLSAVASLGAVVCAPSHLQVAGDAVRHATRAIDRCGLVIALGRPGSGRRSLLASIAGTRGLDVLEVHGTAFGRDPESALLQVRAIARECQLLQLVPLVRDLDRLAEAGDLLGLLEAELPGLVLATSSQPIARRWKRPPTWVDLAAISAVQRRELWRRALPNIGDRESDRLATMYPIAPAMIAATGAAAVEQSTGSPIEPQHIETALRSVLDDRIANIATPLRTTQEWSSLILPEDQFESLTELKARISERTRVYETWGFGNKLGKGLGVCALFSGPPGTGKSMAASLIAKELHTAIYQVDLSKITSKWIGETEKNLAALFDAAEAGQAILLFDEADALFGKRTDVKSSNDRHANQEINYLLQRMESFSGVCILTTNHEIAMDEAFRRRLALHVRFPLPEVAERRRLWESMIPEDAPTAGKLGLDKLADQFEMSGGYIRNAVLRAAFLAAHENGPINSERLIRAALREYEAMGKVIASR